MSELGLNSSIYRVTRKYVDLLNCYLVEIRSDPNSVNKDIEEKVVDLFRNLAQEDSTDPQIQMLAVIIERDFRLRGKNARRLLGEVLISLAKNDLGRSTVAELEMVTAALSDECSVSLSRMQGFDQ